MPARKTAATAAKKPAAKAAAAPKKAPARKAPAKSAAAEAPAQEAPAKAPAKTRTASKPKKPASGTGSVVRCMATLYYVNHREVNEMSGKYQADVCHLSDAAVEALEEMGIDVRYESQDEALEKAQERAERNEREFDPEKVVAREHFVTVKSNKPLRIADADGVLLDEDIAVGTGSTAIVAITPYNWEFKGKSGTSASMRSCRIQELVEFEGAEDPLDDDDAPVL